MEESEKMTALKKAYAEIILNTAKEAAAKIMASERRAHKFRHDLSESKEEALRLLLRFKQTMDSKISEAEKKSLCQQKKIDELEAQLQEAEDIVTNLRSELNEVHIRLDETAKTQNHNAPEITKNVVCVEEVTQHVNAVYGYNCVPDVPSTISRSKEPDMYRNGCTQRIRACDGNLLNGHFSLSDNQVEIKEVKNNDKPSRLVSSLIRRKKKRGNRYRRSYTSLVFGSEVKDKQVEDEDREVANSLVLIREQSIPEDCLESVPTINMEPEVSGKLDWIPSPPAKERVLKYTFQRKRKRETLSSENSTSLNQENSTRREMAKNENESPKSSAAIEISRDSRRMAQVARQVPDGCPVSSCNK